MSDEPEWEVVVRRANGRFVKAYTAGRSQYAAKQVAKRLDGKYDHTHILEIQPVDPRLRPTHDGLALLLRGDPR